MPVTDHIYSGLQGAFKGEQKVKQSLIVLFRKNVACVALLSVSYCKRGNENKLQASYECFNLVINVVVMQITMNNKRRWWEENTLVCLLNQQINE